MSAVTIEESLELDVNLFNREGWLDEDGQAGTLQWIRAGDEAQVATVGYAYIDEDDVEAVVVFYTISPEHTSSEDREVVLPISIERTECHFGGERPWFQCPECHSRKAKLYKPPNGADRFLCRDCHGLLYRSQTYQSPLAEAFDRLDDAASDVQEDGLSQETVREFYEAKQNVIETFNDRMGDLDDEFGERDWHNRMNELPPFDEWVEDLLAPDGACRDYGEFGQCEARAQTTDERCRQPATDKHGKCHYHGGADGSGVSKTGI
jgi:hypothetical protein